MNVAALLALAALAQEPATGAPAAPLDRLAALAPRARVAGLAGFQSSSTITFDDPAARPHNLESTYVFPGRARWQMTPHGAAPGERHVVYRCGEAFFELAPLQERARLVSDRGAEDEHWRASLASFELRRALFLWPDGFEWKSDGGVRRAALPSGEELEVELGADGRPVAMFVAGARDARDTYRAITWRESRGRWWPSTMELVSDGARVWRERVDSLETEVRVLDLYFLPPELRALAHGTENRPIHADVPACYWLRVALPASADWNVASKRWEELAKSHEGATATAWKLEGGACFELGKVGEPVAALLRFAPGTDPPPEGLVKVREHVALTVATKGTGAQLASALGAARAALPPTCAGGLAYARFSAAPAGDAPVQVFLSLVARE